MNNQMLMPLSQCFIRNYLIFFFENIFNLFKEFIQIKGLTIILNTKGIGSRNISLTRLLAESKKSDASLTSSVPATMIFMDSIVRLMNIPANEEMLSARQIYNIITNNVENRGKI